MSQDMMYMLEDMMETSFVINSVGPTISLIAYVFSALALYTIARRRGIKKPWLAWIPVVNMWILGSISDQYRYVVKNEVRSRRKVLLILNIISAVLGLVSAVLLIGAFVSVISAGIQGASETVLMRQLFNSLMTAVLMLIPISILSIVTLVFRYLALYDVYASSDPDNKMIYLVLSVIPVINQVAQPLFLFLCRDKDAGMPPRREHAEETFVEYE